MPFTSLRCSPFPPFAPSTTTQITRRRISRVPFNKYQRIRVWDNVLTICSCQGGIPEYGDDDMNDDVRLPSTILVERYEDGSTKRYIFDNIALLQTIQEDATPTVSATVHESPPTHTHISWLPGIFQNFVLPAGFPGSVSDDYLAYMLLQFPTNVTAWVCHTLVTSSLLKAVGVGSVSGTTVAASTAAIRWVSKDGFGAFGRLLIGGRFGGLFDDDPKQWRMYADFIGSAGSIFELSTQLYPAYFLPLASLGNLAKAVARGLKDPSFRVIQNHFAVSLNLGDVAAKEEVWEVAAQLLGLGLGILVLATPGLMKSYTTVTCIWLSMRILHLWLRYQSLNVLVFPTINLKRARILANAHVSGSAVPGCVECNREENILYPQRSLKPKLRFGVSLNKMIGRDGFTFKTLWKSYWNEKYILTVLPKSYQQARNLEVLITFKVGATSLSVLRSIWQSYWLYQHWRSDSVYECTVESLLNLEEGFDDFLQQLKKAGWDINMITLKVPNSLVIEEINPPIS
ncbi:protein root UVB sensitive 5 isoform X1 [Amborella trichopoda]|uniref:protein root UVB sensitive 5 isoform X1 n=1 Tax=Amborella trichopoda TaxID=13333 RepID=UPI0005D400B8|nr:protein root UVB sensitive 5 isoform X1 [Amborella trichopoda]|eukprot:XP_011624841.1 protein root UVB sensitive 5 isoform X1 [Amborella trichopoda]